MPLKNHDHGVCENRHLEAFSDFWSLKSKKLHLRLTHGLAADTVLSGQLAGAHKQAHERKDDK